MQFLCYEVWEGDVGFYYPRISVLESEERTLFSCVLANICQPTWFGERQERLGGVRRYRRSYEIVVLKSRTTDLLLGQYNRICRQF